jgi:hypothetical protein
LQALYDAIYYNNVEIVAWLFVTGLMKNADESKAVQFASQKCNRPEVVEWITSWQKTHSPTL